MNEWMPYLKTLYPDAWEAVAEQVEALLCRWEDVTFQRYPWVNQRDVFLITYGDALQRSGERPLETLRSFLSAHLADCVNVVHLLPVFPYSSDDGFSVIDFREIDPCLGTWDDIARLHENFDLMLDAVINHASSQSVYFQGFLRDEPACRDFFIKADPEADYSSVTRPRVAPLLTAFDTRRGVEHIWTTFSEDQIDFNFQNPRVLLEVLDILLLYASRGARFIRLDAIGFAWKELGTTSMHLPQTHALIKLCRAVVQQRAKGCSIITETNVPHADNISYFGNGHDEAAMVYQFPLPPLVLFSFLSESAERLTAWAQTLKATTEDTTYFNFLASHDGIGMRPVEDLLGEDERRLMVEETLRRGGEIGYRRLPDGSEAAYELNINYLDAVAGDCPNDVERARKFLASQCILLSMMGVPALYYHSLLGSRGDRRGFAESGIKRRINREKLDADVVEDALRDADSLRAQVLSGLRTLITHRKALPAFAPNSPQQVLALDRAVFALLRGAPGAQVLVLVNVSARAVELSHGMVGKDLLSGLPTTGHTRLSPYQYAWIVCEE